MLLPKEEVAQKKIELEQENQMEMIRLRQSFNNEKLQIELDTKRMRSEKDAIAKDLEIFCAESGHKRTVVLEEIEGLYQRRQAEEQRLNQRKPDYDILYAQVEEQVKSLEFREKLAKESMERVRAIVEGFDAREKEIIRKEKLIAEIEGESFLSKIKKYE
jgi:uncharacterized Zn finger protein (UPF0148 family)